MEQIIYDDNKLVVWAEDNYIMYTDYENHNYGSIIIGNLDATEDFLRDYDNDKLTEAVKSFLELEDDDQPELKVNGNININFWDLPKNQLNTLLGVLNQYVTNNLNTDVYFEYHSDTRINNKNTTPKKTY